MTSLKYWLAGTLALASPSAPHAALAQELKGFVTREGDQLMEDGKPFRFISFNIPNLQMVEDNYALDAKTPWRYPDEFELNDALESVRQMGGTVVRTYVISVKAPQTDMGDSVYVLGPGEFNEEAFKALDLALDVAREKGIRLIIPLVDNWIWQGGRGEYAAFRGKGKDDFWTDERVIADYEQTIRHVLTRVNSRSGIPYKDDPAILCWETGNELDSPAPWTRRIAAFIKSIDPNHLVMDGYSLHGLRQESIDDPNIDIVTTHHYPNVYEAKFVEPILKAREMSRGKKPYVVGEFGFCPTDEIERVDDAVIKEGVSGALLWSLRFHNRDGGFYWHFEPAGGDKYKAYHWPGFDSGVRYDEKAVLDLQRRKAFEIRGLPAPPIEAPRPPTLLPIANPAAISWQGSAGASSYRVERAPAEAGLWEVAADGVDDTLVQYRPLFNDEGARPGRSYFYRVTAKNSAGESAPSNVVGPVAVDRHTLVDECRDLSLSTAHEGNVSPSEDTRDRKRREDVHRLVLPAGSSVTYEVDAPIEYASLIVFRDPASKVTPAVSYVVDGKETPAEVEETVIHPGGTVYDYFAATKLDAKAPPRAGRRLRILAKGESGEIELGRVEIGYRDREE